MAMPDRVEHLRPDRRAERHDVVRRAAVVARHLAAAGADVVGLGEVGGDDVLGAHAERHGRWRWTDRTAPSSPAPCASAHEVATWAPSWPWPEMMKAILPARCMSHIRSSTARARSMARYIAEHVVVGEAELGVTRRGVGLWPCELPPARRGSARRRPPARPRRAPRAGSDGRGRSWRSRRRWPRRAGPGWARRSGRRHAGR